MRTRIKICGVTRPGDAELAARLGADAVGVIFYPDSPRAVDIARAREIAAALPAFVTLTALFLNPAPALVEAVLERLPVGLLQFHGGETAAFCRRFGRAYMKAVSMRAPLKELDAYGDAAALVLDSHAPGAAGGTGATFDWSRLPDTSRPVVLAGGLGPDNVAAAIRQVRPWGVDVASGVESAPGIKDPDKLERFIAEVRRAG